MGTLSRFYGHNWHRCTSPRCWICAEKVLVCSICGGVGRSLPTDCPGVLMSLTRAKQVEEGAIDYSGRNNRWYPPRPNRKKRYD